MTRSPQAQTPAQAAAGPGHDDPGAPASANLPASLRATLEGLRTDMLALARAVGPERYPPSRARSVANLAHYLALRRHDLRPVQQALAELGLSSLGRAEGRALDNVEGVLTHLRRLDGSASPGGEAASAVGRGEREGVREGVLGAGAGGVEPVTLTQGRAHLERHTLDLLGPAPAQRDVRIMVTMPTEAARDGALVAALLEAGMDVMRINCAHDSPDQWLRMIEHLARARERLGRPCRVCMDLAGPKIRTGALPPGPRVARWQLPRDSRGVPTGAACVWLAAPTTLCVPAAAGLRPAGMTPAELAAAFPGLDPALARSVRARVPVDAGVLADLRAGDVITFTDTRGRPRALGVTLVTPAGALTQARAGAFVDDATVFSLRRAGDAGPCVRTFSLSALPPLESSILVRPGDELVLTADPTGGALPVIDELGRQRRVGVIPFTLPEVFPRIRPGDSVWLDDGKIGATVLAADPGAAARPGAAAVRLRITQAPAQGVRLRADKGVNFPGLDLGLSALTEKDRLDLAFIARHADMVALSFVQRAADVRAVRALLLEHDRPDLGLVLKIETHRAFEHLPELLLEAMHAERGGVMIARGDLAVECGYERLAEVQEELLWLCEAAHLPVIWATQVLEGLAKKGRPSRAEITDAAMSTRAECVMLNKGPHVVRAVRTLDDILRRMQAHVRKKSPTLRPLALARQFVP